MPSRTNGFSVALWVLAFIALYLVLAIVISLAAGPFRPVAIWLAGAACWLTSAAMDAAPYLVGASPARRSHSATGQARATGLRWALCGLLLVNAALQIWRAFQPGDSTFHIARLAIRLLPLDFRLTPTGLDPVALLIGLALTFLGLSEVRLRLKLAATGDAKPSAALVQ